jgi:predicted amidohydrolase YtcJ
MCLVCTPLFKAFLTAREGVDPPDPHRRRFVATGIGLAAATTVGGPAFASGPAANLPSGKADLIFVNGDIITVNDARPSAEAVAVKDGIIVGLGKRADIEAAFKGPLTSTFDLNGRALIPGFIDPHSHIAQYEISWGTPNLSPPPVGEVKSIDDIIRLLRDYIAKKNIPPGETVFAGGYDDSLLAENRHPTRMDLDKASTDHPIVLVHASGHLVAANSAALAAAKYTKDTPDPKGGVIRRQPDGEPNGVVEELAGLPFLMLIKPHTLEQRLKNFREIQAYYASLGVTTAQDGISMAGDVELMKEAANRGDLIIDVVSYPRWDQFNDVLSGKKPLNVTFIPPGTSGADGPTVYAPAQAPAVSDDARTQVGVYRKRLKFGGIKITADGSPQGKTAFLTQPYVKPPPGAGADYKGYPTVTQDELDRWFDFAWTHGFQVLVHCNGDGAADMMIAAVRKTIAARGPRDLRPVMIHAQMIRHDQVDEMAKLGIVPSFFTNHTFFWGDWHIAETVGRERAFGMSPARYAGSKGIAYTNHTDAAVTPPSHILAMWTAVNRVSRSGVVVGPNERISPLEALKAVTINAARQYFEEASKGSIEVGKRADLVVLDRNPLTVDPMSIREIKVENTLKDGRVIYSA